MNNMELQFNDLLTKLKVDNPQIKFKENEHFSWNHTKTELTYHLPKTKEEDTAFISKLLHELAHAKLNHSEYRSDAQLLKIESSAWKLAKELANKYGVKLSKQEQAESLQSYIDWASSRSKCPKCNKNGLQNLQTEFICPNCSNSWRVSKSRFKRTYRR